MHYTVRIVATEVVKEHQDFKANRALQVALAVGFANKPPRNVVVVTDFGVLRFILYKLMTAYVAPSCIIIFLLLVGTQSLYRQICAKNRYDLPLPTQ